MEVKFKFEVGEEVQYRRHPNIKFLIVERFYQECYNASQCNYKVRQLISESFRRSAGFSVELHTLVEIELEPITKKEEK